MVEILRLKKNENPPGDTPCVVVTRDSSREHTGEGQIVEHSNGATFYLPFHAKEDELRGAMQDALRWAEEHGLGCVYVQE